MLAKTSPQARAGRGLLLALLLAAPGCARAEETVAAPDLETRLLLKDAAGKESAEFQGRETVTLAVVIRNRGASPRTLTFPSSQTHDCIVHAGEGTEVWRWSAGRMFAQVLTELTLAPGESRTFTITWDLTDRKGAPLPPGDYRAVGLVAARVPGARSAPATFTIRPREAKKPSGTG
jgi:hypothetical protein